MILVILAILITNKNQYLCVFYLLLYIMHKPIWIIKNPTNLLSINKKLKFVFIYIFNNTYNR